MNNVTILINSMVIKKRSDNRLEGRLTVNGIRKSFYGSTKAEIKQKAKKYLEKVENGYKEPKKITLNEYIEYWLITYKFNKIEPSSYTRLYRVFECQIKNSVGDMKIGSISTKDIQKLIDDHANPIDETTKPLALSGLKRIMNLLNPCFDMAVKEGIISSNPCNNVILPIESCIATPTKRQYSLNDNEIEEFRIAALSKYKTRDEYCSRDGFILLLILNLGLRVGEILALEWENIDINKGLIYISKTVQSNVKDFHNEYFTKNYCKVKQSTKTRAGKRIVPINIQVKKYIEELIEYDKRNNINSCYVCSTSTGTRNTARNLQRSLDRILKKTSISKRVSLHTLRHTFGSTLIRRGVGVEVVSKLMGHANITITYNKYIHVLQEEEVKAMNMIKIC